MENKYNLNSHLGKSRYYSVTGDNVLEVRTFNAFASSDPLELSVKLTYLDIITNLKRHFSIEENPTSSLTQQYRNFLSTLNSYLAFCGKTVESNVGSEFGDNFDSRLRDYLANIAVAVRTRRDRATQLKKIRSLCQGARTTIRPQLDKQTTLSVALQKLIANSGTPPKTLAKQSGVDPTTLRRWLNGATPRADTIAALRRLELRLGVQRDSLVGLIENASAEQAPVSIAPSHRLRMAARKNHNLTLSESVLGEVFIREWSALFDYKSTSFPLLERHSNGTWGLIPQTASPRVSALACRGTRVCPTADTNLYRLRSFLGVVLNLPSEEGGIHWLEAPPITIAWCAHPQALQCYLDWLTTRSDGVRHNGQKVFARFICSLLRPTTGFLWQQPAVFRERLPQPYRPNDDDAWQEMCARSHKLLRDYINTSNGISRNPQEPVSDLLALSSPLRPIYDAIKRIDADASDAVPGSVTEARHKRNALLLALLLSNPLRARTLMSLTWLPNGHGTLRGNAQDGWRLYLDPIHFKNGKTQKDKKYSVKIADWVKPMVDSYVEEYRETLLGDISSPYFFVGDEEGEMWEGLSKTVLKLTRRYIPGSPGFSAHAMRHLVATDWLRKHPDDFLTVAELLNDKLETVLNEYAHLRRDDSFSRYESYMDSITQGSTE